MNTAADLPADLQGRSSLALRSIDQNSPKKATESLTFDNTWYSYLFIFNLKYLQRDEDRERGVPFIGSLWLQWPDLNQIEARGWELHLILPCVSAAQILGSFCMLFPGNSCGAGFEVDQLGRSLYGCWYWRRWLYLHTPQHWLLSCLPSKRQESSGELIEELNPSSMVAPS